MNSQACRRLRLGLGGGIAAITLSGCVSDPAFLEGLAMATEAIAAETAAQAHDARCYRHLNRHGYWETFCPLPPGTYVPYKDRDRWRERPRDSHSDRDRRNPRSGERFSDRRPR
ncbi:MAG: hypothetical protein ACK4E3_06980 [Brevundimonas sp.]|uniref:hypothetical protein n=1 Tax=Brevundimonas sp. TaxID=1871086 RepID=UPI0039194129